VEPPARIDLKREEALTIEWADGRVSRFPVAYLRRMSPSADMRELRQQMERDPLTVLPRGGESRTGGGVVATGAELVGNYAIRITFSDGHSTGIYSWEYLRSLDPGPGGADPDYPTNSERAGPDHASDAPG